MTSTNPHTRRGQYTRQHGVDTDVCPRGGRPFALFLQKCLDCFLVFVLLSRTQICSRRVDFYKDISCILAIVLLCAKNKLPLFSKSSEITSLARVLGNADFKHVFNEIQG